jgi:hypothetical protein
MHLTAEVIGKFDHAADADSLLYAPLDASYKFRQSRRYHVEFDGSQDELEAFLSKVLANETSHELSTGIAPALADWSFTLDYGMKAGALDHEKETILEYYRGLGEQGFTLHDLKIEHRIYLLGVPSAQRASVAEQFVRDVVNPAVHRHVVTVAA